MSDPPRRLPPGPSLEQLRKQAKDLKRAATDGDAEARARIARHKPKATTPTLADAQYALARELGFASWAALARHVDAIQPEGAGPHGYATKPPYYQIDWIANRIEPRQPLSDADWDVLIEVMVEHGLTGLDAHGWLTDGALGRLARVDQLTELVFDGTRRVTDAGLRHLAALPQLESLDLSDHPGGTITDRGLECLRHLPGLRRFKMCWQAGVTDAGIAHLAGAEALEEVNLLGTPTGDGALAALRGKPALALLRTGRLTTDAGLALLPEFPVFRRWTGGTPEYGLMTFGDSGPNHLVLDGPFTDRGLASLDGLDGLFGLTFFWHTPGLTSDGLRALVALPHLGALGCQDRLADDVAMGHIAAIPGLRSLMAQGTVATAAGYAALARSATLEYLWGREAPGLDGPGLRALSTMPALKGLAVSLERADEASLATLPRFPALTELVPMGLSDAQFRHVGACHGLERLVCMYCRETGDGATGWITGLSRLLHYYAGQTKITDRSLEILSGLETLEDIALSGCRSITDRGLARLATLPRLKRLAVDRTEHVTRAGIAAFPPGVRVTLWA